MLQFKKELAMATAQVMTQSELLKNPRLNPAESVARNFITACKYFDTEQGKKTLTAAQNALVD